jgi:site-specific DNA-methyltransferase (cytosine-N4-specific)
MGSAYLASIEDFLDSPLGKSYIGKVQLILTSPPYPLVVPKKYGNRVGDDYLNWIANLAPKLKALLKPEGSLVMEIGNSWDKGSPTMSLLPLKTLMAVADSSDMKICQQFIWNNPAKLPGPATWVNIKRVRVTDSYTHLWWYSPSEHPKANNRNVLIPYGDGMKKLLKTKKYNSGVRPSGHIIGEKSFFTNNGGAIPSSALNIANAGADSKYRDWCNQNGVPQHPARMPIALADFFIKFLTDENDLVFDPFGGSLTTAKSAEDLNRNWLSTEADEAYLIGGKGRFRN